MKLLQGGQLLEEVGMKRARNEKKLEKMKSDELSVTQKQMKMVRRFL